MLVLKQKHLKLNVNTVRFFAASVSGVYNKKLSATFSTDEAQACKVKNEILNKYKDKLKRKADSEGLSTINELIEKQSQVKAKPIEKESKKPFKKSTEQSLASIMKLEMLEEQPTEIISRLWTAHHLDKELLSAVIPTPLYKKLKARLQLCPQAHFNQLYFTSLSEYKTLGSQARPHLVLTHYPELSESKNIILMRGELGLDPKDSACPISLAQAQLLVHQFQKFYVANSPAKWQLVTTFNSNPTQFDHHKLIEEAETFE